MASGSRVAARILILFGLLAAGCALLPAPPPPGASTRLESLSFIDAQNGWLVADECPADVATAPSSACRTIVWQSVDGGQSWTRQARFLLSPRVIQFVDHQIGWLIGSIGEKCGSTVCPNVVMLSDDGGKTWNRVAMASAELIDAAAATPTDAWAIGRRCRVNAGCNAVLVRTTSSGQIWDNQDLSLTGESFHVDRFDVSHGWIGSDPATADGAASILATTDDGATWQMKSTPCEGATTGLSFASPLAGWLVCTPAGSDGNAPDTLFRTSDGGGTWSRVASIGERSASPPALPSVGGPNIAPTTLAPDAARLSLTFSSATRGWIVLPRGVLLASSNAGQSWHSALTANEALRGIEFVDEKHGWLLGTGGVWRTIDGGESWQKISVS